MNNCNLALKGRNTLALTGHNTLAMKGRNIIKTLPHHLVTATDVGLVHAAFQGESSRNNTANVVGRDETAAVEVG